MSFTKLHDAPHYIFMHGFHDEDITVQDDRADCCSCVIYYVPLLFIVLMPRSPS